MLAKRYLHLIDPQGLSTWENRRHGLQCLQRYSLNAELTETAGFADWIGHHSSGIHTFLLDLPDEGFHLEQIPPVSGQDRQQLIARRQMQQFFGSPFVTAIPLGRVQDGRRDEHVLLVALTRPGSLLPWLQALREAEARLARICSPALLTPRLLRLLRPTNPQGLILSFSRSGIRQTYFEQGSLRFSRLSSPPEGDFQSWGKACLNEARKTVQYLGAQRWTTPDTPIPVWLLVRQADYQRLLQDMIEPVPSGNPLEFQLAELGKLARQAGLKTELDDSDSTPLMMRLALRERGNTQLAPKSDRRFYHLWRLRNAIFALGLAGSLWLGLLACKHYQESLSLQASEKALLARLAEDRQRYERLLAKLPAMPVKLETLQATLSEHQRLTENRPAPGKRLKQISHAFDLYPNISLQRLEWLFGMPETPSAKRKSVYLLDASLAGEPHDARQAIAMIQAFAAELQKQTGGQAFLTSLPFESSPDRTLHSEAINTPGRAGFKLRLQIQESRS